jgi:hypothetical protein
MLYEEQKSHFLQYVFLTLHIANKLFVYYILIYSGHVNNLFGRMHFLSPGL